jgi:hypothetical protein
VGVANGRTAGEDYAAILKLNVTLEPAAGSVRTIEVKMAVMRALRITSTAGLGGHAREALPAIE